MKCEITTEAADPFRGSGSEGGNSGGASGIAHDENCWSPREARRDIYMVEADALTAEPVTNVNVQCTTSMLCLRSLGMRTLHLVQSEGCRQLLRAVSETIIAEADSHEHQNGGQVPQGVGGRTTLVTDFDCIRECAGASGTAGSII